MALPSVFQGENGLAPAESGLIDTHGRPLSTKNFKKADPPNIGAFGPWAGHDMIYAQLPGGGMLQFNLDRLSLRDFRGMRDHYQVNANLIVLQFMLHQMDWRIKGPEKAKADFLDEQLRKNWSALVRSLSQANWAGYSPNALEWANDVQGRAVVLDKIKDFIPEDCLVHWKVIDGWAPPGHVNPRVRIFDGIRQIGMPFPVPVGNSFWYPLLMENGNYYGKKLLRAAFAPWFFSQLLHLFANRYYERFGEPVPIGRAPFEETVKQDGKDVSGDVAMRNILQALRNRSVVVLPSERQQVSPTRTEYDYDIQYLESQMRGADFERYMSRLDEEISIGLFTPVLLLRAVENGSYNLGVGHMQMYMWMLNALAGDRKTYIDKYIINPLTGYNFSQSDIGKYEWQFRPMGKQNVETIRALVAALATAGRLKPDFDELSDIVGLTVEEQAVLTAPDGQGDPSSDPGNGNDGSGDTRQRGDRKSNGPKGPGQDRSTKKDISARLASQVQRAYRSGTFGRSFVPSLGYAKQLEQELEDGGVWEAKETARLVLEHCDNWIKEAQAFGKELWDTPEAFMAAFELVLDGELDDATADAA